MDFEIMRTIFFCRGLKLSSSFYQPRGHRTSWLKCALHICPACGRNATRSISSNFSSALIFGSFDQAKEQERKLEFIY